MKLKTIDKIINTTILITLVISPILIHEYTHGYIYNEAGCQEIEYGLMPESNKETLNKPFAVTTAHCNNLNQEEHRNIELKQTMVEAAGYQIIPLYIVVGVLFILINIRITTLNKHLELQTRYMHKKTM